MGKKKRNQRKKTANQARQIGTVLVVSATLVAVAVLGFLGWQWQANLAFRGITVTGTQFADTTQVASLAGITADTMLFDIDPALVEDRAVRHPWVRAVNVTRQFSGLLEIAVEERTPTVLIMDAEGRPSHFLDAEGYAMPLAEGAVFDVPLVRGFREVYHPVRPVQDAAMLDLLTTLNQADASTDALLSEFVFEASGEVLLHTSPTLSGHSIPVRLGQSMFAEKLKRLHAFWHQAILAKQDTQFDSIDLRYRSQIVTQERTNPASG